MKTMVRVLLAMVCMSIYGYAFGGISDDIAKLGFPDDAVTSFVQIIEQQKSTEAKIPVINGIKVWASVWNGELCFEGCRFSWPETANYNPKAKKYVFRDYILFHWINNGKNIFYRDEFPKAEKPALKEKKAEMPKTLPAPVQKTEGNGVEKVYEASVLPFSLKDLENGPITAIVVPIYKSPWIGDGLGAYTVINRNEKEVSEVQVRKNWRVFVGNNLYSSVITKFGTYIFVIIPGKTKEEITGKEIVIVSGSGKYALTISANMTEFKLNDFKKSEEYRNVFFEKNPSKVEGKMLIDISPDTENGKAFIRDLQKLFPNEYLVKDKMISTGTDIETLKALAGESNNSNYFRRVIQKGGLPNISLSSVACPPCELARMLIVWSIAAFDETLKGNFLEAKVSGYQAAQALSPYLAECQEEMNYMQKIILSARQ